MRTPEQLREYDRLYKRKWRKTAAGREQKARVRDFKSNLKQGACVDCGKTYKPVAMEFDHLPGSDKSFKVSQNGYRSQERVLKEIAKCDLVCVLCHRDRTYMRYERSNSRTAQARRRLHEKVAAFKRAPCGVCGVQYKPWQMDFDHLDPEAKVAKVEKVTEMVRKRRALSSIVEEISKCRLLCALCHRLWTEEQAHV